MRTKTLFNPWRASMTHYTHALTPYIITFSRSLPGCNFSQETHVRIRTKSFNNFCISKLIVFTHAH